MRIFQPVRQSLDLLSPTHRRKFILLIGFQFLTSLLDLLAVMAMGVLTIAGTAGVSSENNPGLINNFVAPLRRQFASESDLLIVLGAAAAFLFFSKSLISLYFSRRALRFLSVRSVEISEKSLREFLNNSLVFVQKRPSQEIVVGLSNGVSSSMLIILGSVSTLASEVGLLVILGVGLFVLDPFLTFFSLAYFALLLFGLQRILSSIGIRSGREGSLTSIQAISLIQEVITSFREMYVADKFKFTVSKFLEIRNRGSKSVADAQWVGLVPKYAMESALILGASLLAVYQFTKNDSATAIGVSIVFLASGSRILPSLLRIQGAISAIQSNLGPAEYSFRLIEELKHESNQAIEGLNAESSPVSPQFRSSISLKGVCFSYPGKHVMALSEINLEIPAGSTIAIVGGSGAGKSTLVDLILGLHSPQKGEVWLSGVSPRRAIKLWPGKVGYVPQVVSLFNSTVRENVAIGRDQKDIDDKKVWVALEKSHLADFIRENPEGLEMGVGERGLKLSGGQKQRLGLARALYEEPELLVLDEATSALDAETEEAISNAINSLPGRTTRITIAHRLATVRGADNVIFMENGHIIASGTFEEVRAAVPQFNNQAKLLGL
jgi:ABC-type multidrug transport system fused ATPase/permease subunit